MAEWRRANDGAGGDDPGIDPMEKLPQESGSRSDLRACARSQVARRRARSIGAKGLLAVAPSVAVPLGPANRPPCRDARRAAREAGASFVPGDVDGRQVDGGLGPQR